MKRSSILKFGSQFLAFFISFCFAKEGEVCKAGEQRTRSQNFYVAYTNIARLRMKIISEINVYSWIHCGTSCLRGRFCVAYNYKENSKENEINCQLTTTTHHHFEKGRKWDDGWSFYAGFGEKKLSCKEENECKNGGKMVWDPVKPFKCECLDGYEGELCQQNITLAKNETQEPVSGIQMNVNESLKNSTTFNCPDSPCLNGGTCVGGPGNKPSSCNCSFPFKGKYCNLTCREALRFHGNNIQEYGIANGPPESPSSFTISFWLDAANQLHTGALLSYAYTLNNINEANGILFYIYETNLWFVFNSGGPNNNTLHNEMSIISKLPDKLQHLCITWQSDNGILTTYVDGYFANSKNVVGTFLPGGGIWIIGQDQDKLGGGFESNGALRGNITEVHVWDGVLSPAEIKALASTCDANMTGNYLVYSDFAIKGNVERFEPSCCK